MFALSTLTRSTFRVKCLSTGLIAIAILFGSRANAQLTGVKTIGVDYPTVTAAIADLNAQGVGAGGVVFNVPAGYTEALTGKLTITATGTVANPITFQKSGVGLNPILTSYTGTVATPSVIADGFLVLAGSDFVTIDGLDLQEKAANITTTTQMEFGYGLFKASATNGCQNNVIRNCTITLSNLNSTAWTAPGHFGATGIAVLNSLNTAASNLTVTAASGANSNNQIHSNTIQNCHSGVVLVGYAAPSPFSLGDTNNDVGGTSIATGNTIINFGSTAAATQASGIFASNQWGSNYSFNTINNNTGSNTNHGNVLRGIFLSTATSASVTCNNNDITIHGGGTTFQVSGIENTFGLTPAGNTVDINNNSITGDYLTATTGTSYLIYNTATATTVNIQNNTIDGFSYSSAANTGTGSLYPIYSTASNAGATFNISGNLVTNISRVGSSGGTTIGIYCSSGVSGMGVNVTGNTISNMSIDGSGTASTMYGIQTSTGTNVINNNTITNLQCLKATGTGSLYGYYNISSPNNETYTNNQINGLIHNGTGTTYGLYANTAAGVRTVSGNSIYNLSTGGTTIAGIYMFNSTPTVFNNLIYDIESTSSGVPTVSGMLLGSVGASSSAVMYNNLIGDLRAPNANSTTTPSVRGLNVTVSTTNSSLNIANNTVYLAATSGGTNFSTAALYATTSTTATTANLILRNNLLIDTSTPNGSGVSAAYWRSSTALNNYDNASNNNLFYAGVPSSSNLLFNDGTNQVQLLAGLQTLLAPRESASITEFINFLSTTGSDPDFLHVNPAIPTYAESGGTPVGAVTVDFDGDTRNGTTPDIGADEFNGSQPAVCTGTPAPGSAEATPLQACSGNSVSLSNPTPPVGDGIVYQWYVTTTSGSGYVAIPGATAAFATSDPLAVGTYYFVMSSKCTFTNDSALTAEIAVPVAPTPTALPSNNGPVCIGASLNLTGGTDIGTSFAWTGPNGFTSTDQNPSIANAQLAANGTYLLTTTNGFCSSQPTATTVSIIQAPLISSVTATPNPICAGGTSVLNVTSLDPAATLASAYGFAASSGTFTPLVGGTQTSLAATTDGGISTPFPIGFSFFYAGSSYTEVQASSDGFVRFGSGGATTLSNNLTTTTNVRPGVAPLWDDLALSQGITYQTSGSPGSQVLTIEYANVEWNYNSTVLVMSFQVKLYEATGVVQFVYQQQAGAANLPSASVGIMGTTTTDFISLQDVSAAPAISTVTSMNTLATKPATGQIYTFTPPPSTLTAVWSPSTYLDDPNLNSPTATNVAATQAYTVTVSNGACTSPGNVTLTVNPAISGATITPVTPRYCAGASITLTANAIDGGGVFQYQWTDPNNSIAGTNDTQEVNIPGIWQLTISDECGGSPATTSVTVVEDPTPNANPSAGPACLGQTLQFTGSNTAGPGASFAWTGPNGFTSSDQNPSITGLTNAAAGVYSFTVTSAAPANCVSATGTVTVSVNVPPTITVPASATPGTICAGGSTQLSVTATAPGYVIGSGGSSFINISGTGAIIPAPAVLDDNEHPLTIPSFTFNGVPYTDVLVGDNGALIFGTGGTTVNNGNLALPATFGSSPIGLAVFWDDLDNLSTTQIYTQQVGNLFIIQWHEWGHFSAITEGEIITFQVQLDLSSGKIYYAYQDVNFGGAMSANDAGASATIGLGFSLTEATQFSFNTASLTNGQVISFTPASPSFSWDNASLLDNAFIANPIASNVLSGTNFTVTASNAGCIVTSNVIVNTEPPPTATTTVITDCGNDQFSIGVNITSTGTSLTAGLSWTVNGVPGAGSPISGLTTGAITPDLGPFNETDEVVVSIFNSTCTLELGLFYSGCPVVLNCGTPTNDNFCYRNNETRTFFYVTPVSGETVTLNFSQGSIGSNDAVNIYDGSSNAFPSLGGGNFGGNIGGAGFVSSGDSIFFEIVSNDTTSCDDGAFASNPITWTVQCTPACVQPDAFASAIPDCATGSFQVDVFPFSSGDGSTGDVNIYYQVLPADPDTLFNVPLFTSNLIGPYPLGTSVNVTIGHADSTSCNKILTPVFLDLSACPNDEPCEARFAPINPNYTCVQTVIGELGGATATPGITNNCGGAPNRDLWYRFVATAPVHRARVLNVFPGSTAMTLAGFTGPCAAPVAIPGACSTTGSNTVNMTGLTIGDTILVRVYNTNGNAVSSTFDFCASAPPLLDVKATALASPGATGCYTSTMPVTVSITNNAVYAIDFSVDPVTVTTNVTGAAIATLSATLNTGTLAAGASLNVPMSTTLDMSVGGVYTFNANTTLVGDGDNTNNAMAPVNRTVVAPAALPITQDFTGFTGANLNALVAPNNGWSEGTGATVPVGATSLWLNSSATQQTQLGSGVSAKINLYLATRNEWLVGPRFVAQAGTQLTYSIAITEYNSGVVDVSGGMQGTDDQVRAMISTDCGATYSTLYTHNAANTVTVTNTLVPQLIDLTPYAGQQVIIAFLAQDGPVDNTPDYDFHVDNIGIQTVALCAGPPVVGTATSSNPGPDCAPTSTNLSVTGQSTDGGVVVRWYSSPNSGGPYNTYVGVGSTIGVSGIIATTYFQGQVVCTNTLDSVATNVVSTIITPTPTATASNNGPLCEDNPLNLTGGTDIGTTYSWTGPNGFTSTQLSPTIALPTAAATGTYTFTASVGVCSSLATTSVTVNANPVILSTTATPMNICENTATSQLNVAAPASGYTVGSGGSSFINISITGTAVTGVADDSEHNVTIPAFTYNGITYTDLRIGANGAVVFGATTGEIGFSNTVLPSTNLGGAGPAGIAVFWDDLDVLAGVSNLFTQQVGNFFIVQWNDIAHLSDAAGQTATFQIQLELTTGKIYLVYQDVIFGGTQTAFDNGLSATMGLNFSATAATQYSFNTASLTNGQVISFTPNSNNAVWSPGTYLSATNITNPVFGPASSGSYPLTVVVTNPANNCTATANITINSNPALSAGQANITPTVASVCGTSPVVLTANPTGGGGPYTYAWTNPNAIAAGTNQTQSAAIAGVWSVLITDACGGQATATKNVAVFPVPTASASAGPGCVGSALQLNGTSDLGTTFSWSGPNGFTSTVQNPQIPSTTSANSGTYTFTATANGCTSANATVAVTVNPIPAITSLTATPAAICAGSNSQLNVTASVTLPNVLITEVTLWGASGVALGQTPVYPAYIPTTPDDYVELNNASTVPADVSGWTFSDHLSNSAANNHPALTFPPGTVIPANGVLVIGLGLGTQSPSNLYFITGGSSNILSSGGSYCFILRNGSGTIVDAVATNTGVFAPGLGVTPADWSGAGAPSLTSNAGSVRTAANDSNTGADWTTSTVVPQSIGYYNPGYNNPFSGSVTSYTWTPATYLSSTAIANPIATAALATTAYTVSVTGSNGCSNSGSVTLTVNPVPAVSAGSYGPVCGSDAPDVALNGGSPAGGTFSGTGVSGAVGNQVFDPSVGTQTLTYTSSGTCPGTATTTITVNTTDTDLDGVPDCADNCPNVSGQIGSVCDSDPGPGVSPGILDASCNCVVSGCTENIIVDLRTDANSDEASFEIFAEGTSSVVCQGGIFPPYPNGITSPIVANCCLPVGCYKLVVYDSGGDGFVSGGYQVRESGGSGRRIVDNFGNFNTGSQSSVAGPQSFCLPIGDVDLINFGCDKLDWVQYKYLVCHADPSVAAEWVPNGANSVQDANSGYEFWIFDPNGTYSFRRFHAHNVSDGFSPASANRAARLKIHGWYNTVLTPHIPEGVLMNVRVRGRVNGVNQAFGPTCRMMMDAARAACPLVWLQDDNTNTSDYSCGVTRTFGGTNTNANKIVAKPPQFEPPPLAGGTGVRFQFRFRIPGESVCIVLPPQTSPTRYLNWNSTVGAPLVCSKTYEVDVRVSKDGGATWCVDSPSPACYPAQIMEWGRMCTVTIGCTNVEGGGASSMGTQNGGALTMYPNPNRGDLVTIALSEVGADVRTVSVDIYDLRGQRVTARTIAVQDGYLNTVIDLQGDLAGGMYMVNITAGDKTYTERLVIQP